MVRYISVRFVWVVFYFFSFVITREHVLIDVSELYACRDLTTDRPLACIINRHDVIKISPQTLHPKQLQITPMVQQWWVILVVTAVSQRKSSPRLAWQMNWSILSSSKLLFGLHSSSIVLYINIHWYRLIYINQLVYINICQYTTIHLRVKTWTYINIH